MRFDMEINPVVLTGKIIRLEPLSLEHIPDLFEVGRDDSIWKYMVYGSIKVMDDMRAWVEDLLNRQAQGTDLPFTVVLIDTCIAIGATRYLDIRPDDRALEIGGTWYGTAYQRTGVNTEAKYLLLRHAFERLDCVRVQLKTDMRNIRSQKAIERIGAVKEGVLRKHMILPDGYVRDSVIYSIIDTEWPSVRAHLEEKMRNY